MDEICKLMPPILDYITKFFFRYATFIQRDFTQIINHSRKQYLIEQMIKFFKSKSKLFLEDLIFKYDLNEDEAQQVHIFLDIGKSFELGICGLVGTYNEYIIVMQPIHQIVYWGNRDKFFINTTKVIEIQRENPIIITESFLPDSIKLVLLMSNSIDICSLSNELLLHLPFFSKESMYTNDSRWLNYIIQK